MFVAASEHATSPQPTNPPFSKASKFPAPSGRRAGLQFGRFHAKRSTELVGVARFALSRRNRDHRVLRYFAATFGRRGRWRHRGSLRSQAGADDHSIARHGSGDHLLVSRAIRFHSALAYSRSGLLSRRRQYDQPDRASVVGEQPRAQRRIAQRDRTSVFGL